jgi:hypothetical protein
MTQSAARTIVLAALFCASFLILGASYHALPSELPTLRLAIGQPVRWAPKSLFAVFRVPIMNLIHGLMAGIMLSREACFGDPERRAGYSNIFSTLAFMVAIKANFEALEIAALAYPAIPATYANWLGFGTAASVFGGLGLALFRGRKAPLPWPELRMPTRGRATLLALFLGYLSIVAASFVSSHTPQ